MWRDYKPNTMNKQFILLTTTENTEIIICLSNIATIQAAERNQNMTEIKFNYAKDNELQPYFIVVKEEFGLVKSMLGLK